MATETQWIGAPESLRESLLLSGVIKLAHDRLGKKYCMIRRAAFTELLAGHPGIERIDYLPKGVRALPVGGCVRGAAAGGAAPRAFQRLAKMFGLELPAPENMYLPMHGVSDALPASMVPWREKNVAIAPDSSSPDKMMPRDKWGQVARELCGSGALVVQFGQGGAEKVKHAYSLAGVTTLKEAVLLLKRMDLLITTDNFLMHAARLAGTPAIVLWRTADEAAHGYPEHQQIIAEGSCPSCLDAGGIAGLALKTLAAGRAAGG